MSSHSVKTRPIHYSFDTSYRSSAVAPGIVAVETREPPADVQELVASWPSLLGARPETTAGSTTIAVRTEAGELLSTVTVGPGRSSPLAEVYGAAALDKTRYLSELAWSDGAASYAPHALYLAVRRARIEDAVTIAAHVKDVAGALGETLRMVKLDAPPGPGGREAQGQRVDLAARRAYDAVVETSGAHLDPSLFGNEVIETFERWLVDLYGRGFFKAVAEGTLSREQYVYTISNMHQFVRWTTRLLGHAVAHSHDRKLRDHFLAHLSGEVNHETIIERDLAHLGEDVGFVVDRMAASPGTRQFMAVQESLAGLHHDLILFLASPLAAEGIASHLTPEFLAAMESVIAGWGVRDPKRAMTFLSSHVNTDGGDDGHWELVIRVVRDHLGSDDDLRRFLGILRASTRALTMAYDEFVDDVALFAPRRTLTPHATNVAA